MDALNFCCHMCWLECSNGALSCLKTFKNKYSYIHLKCLLAYDRVSSTCCKMSSFSLFPFWFRGNISDTLLTSQPAPYSAGSMLQSEQIYFYVKKDQKLIKVKHVFLVSVCLGTPMKQLLSQKRWPAGIPQRKEADPLGWHCLLVRKKQRTFS